MQEIGIMDVGGFQVGHAQDLEGATGCTVILCDRMSPAGLDVRGGGPASRESQILNPVAAAEGINAVLLSGGSAFGLDAAGGVQRYLCLLYTSLFTYSFRRCAEDLPYAGVYRRRLLQGLKTGPAACVFWNKYRACDFCHRLFLLKS